MENLYHFVIHYGYLSIFFLLMVGIFGVPVPDELLVIFVGYLIFQKELQLWPAALAVIFGSMVGISVNYVVGRTIGGRLCKWLAYFFPNKREKLTRVTDWVNRSGGIMLFLSYFLPGVRHWATVGAGIVKLSPTAGVLSVFPAATLWSLGFIFLGYHLGKTEAGISKDIYPYLLLLSGVMIVCGFLGYRFITKKPRTKWCSAQRIIP
jgi:membrane protein DedA with SNARE-associated domain